MIQVYGARMYLEVQEGAKAEAGYIEGSKHFSE
jgi:hypothetical protein